jgi:hypothetical protein
VMLAVLPFVGWSLAVLVLICAFPILTLGIGGLAAGL